MIVKECRGYELQKSKPNSPEDFFNRSEVEYVSGGKQKALQVTYLRYFEDGLQELTDYPADPIFSAGGREFFFRDIVALVCLFKNKDNEERKRIYISNREEFSGYFNDFEKVRTEAILGNLGKEGLSARQ